MKPPQFLLLANFLWSRGLAHGSRPANLRREKCRRNPGSMDSSGIFHAADLPGVNRVQVRDSKGNSQEARIVVVSSEEIPELLSADIGNPAIEGQTTTVVTGRDYDLTGAGTGMGGI